MRKYVLLLGMFVSTQSLFAQKSNALVSFYNQDSTLTGFKDAGGKVVYTPQFTETGGRTLENIMAVVKEDKAGKWHPYYMLRNGKKVGRDSMYMFDNGFDCENEGFIRFTTKDKTGLFNRKGEIVIPAEYSSLSRVINGMLVSLKGAQKKIDGEHFFWTGGKDALIDTANHVLIEDFAPTKQLDLYSIRIENNRGTDTLREYFKGTNGKWYSFVVYEKEFTAWLHKELLPALTKENLLKHSMPEVTYSDSVALWITASKEQFIAKHEKILSVLSQPYQVLHEDLNPFLFDPAKYPTYFNNCFAAKSWKYPLMLLLIDGNQINFLRTEHGYKLILVGLND